MLSVRVMLPFLFSTITNPEGKGDLKDGDGADSDDFQLWSPVHQDGCLFGHRVQYNRKIPTHNCYIGRKIKQPHKILDDCECTRHDYEWFVPPLDPPLIIQ